MTKVSIVGVEGSGKTVLMAVLGEKYKLSDANGLSLKPNNFETFTFVETAAADLRSGQWPAATTPEQLRQISWTLQRTTDKGVESLCELPMLDFAGEIYRLAFGDHTEEEIAPHKEEVEALRNHVATSSCLVVLVNLSHVINGSMKDPRTLETIWLTQRIIEFAKEHHVANVSVGLSQVDRYRAEIEACEGSMSTIRKYLPLVATSYGALPVFELCAVGSVIPDKSGIAMPSTGGKTQGLTELMKWFCDAAGSESHTPLSMDRPVSSGTELTGQGVTKVLPREIQTDTRVSREMLVVLIRVLGMGLAVCIVVGFCMGFVPKWATSFVVLLIYFCGDGWLW